MVFIIYWKELWVAVFLIVSTGAAAQDVTGVYYDRGNSPEGGVSYYVLPDGTFAATYFGGIMTGTWKQEKDVILFKNKIEPKYVLYGRNNLQLKDTIQIRFSIKENDGVAVGFTKADVIPIKQVFNTNANCFGYPYILKILTPVQDLFAANIPYKNVASEIELPVYHFSNLGEYNDFLLFNLRDEYTTPINFSASVENELLYFEGASKGLEKGSLDAMNNEDVLFLDRYINNKLLPDNLTPESEFFPYEAVPTTLGQKPFTKLVAFMLDSSAVLVQSGSLFTATCDDE